MINPGIIDPSFPATLLAWIVLMALSNVPLRQN
jgi:hypothetical protein